MKLKDDKKKKILKTLTVFLLLIMKKTPKSVLRGDRWKRISPLGRELTTKVKKGTYFYCKKDS